MNTMIDKPSNLPELKIVPHPAPNEPDSYYQLIPVRPPNGNIQETAANEIYGSIIDSHVTDSTDRVMRPCV
jgi:hypothetical protein